ncbi:hypothetical protein D5H75_09745 [Bailinhaonella thermotolerans]|uniref:Uncharacterized protein n=1 Tax=Bailinhaonella thermotolerans TaxID=1070861 RepID=A0A3A4B485_9ACTN|nr:hypothetical protein D5H75_09745 [Bailinhaonella thermotolerans]
MIAVSAVPLVAGALSGPAAAGVSASAGAPAARAASPASSSAPSASPVSSAYGGAAAKTVSYRGMRLSIPAAWRVVKQAGSAYVITGRCVPRAYECPGFWLHGPSAIRHGHEGNAYKPSRPYYPSSGMMECSRDRRYLEMADERPRVAALRPIGAKKAHHREWRFKCVTPNGGKVKLTYAQREWFLPRSQILVVDKWANPALPGILARARW